MLRPLVFQSRKQGAALAVSAGAPASFLALIAYAVFQAGAVIASGDNGAPRGAIEPASKGHRTTIEVALQAIEVRIVLMGSGSDDARRAAAQPRDSYDVLCIRTRRTISSAARYRNHDVDHVAARVYPNRRDRLCLDLPAPIGDMNVQRVNLFVVGPSNFACLSPWRHAAAI